MYYKTAAAAAKSLQSCPTLCDPIDGSPPQSYIAGPGPGLLRPRIVGQHGLAPLGHPGAFSATDPPEQCQGFCF